MIDHRKAISYGVVALVFISILGEFVACSPGEEGSRASGTLFDGGEGTIGDPSRISTVAQLQRIEQYLGASFSLVADIDAGDTSSWNDGAGFDPIGGSSPWFTGTFDGMNHTIENLVIDRSGSPVGLFGSIGIGGMVSNIHLVDVDIRGSNHVGSIAGSNGGTITGCHVSGFVTGWDSVGGLVGSNGHLVEYSFSTASVSATGDNIGGLVGRTTQASVKYSFSTGTVTGQSIVGGLVGYNDRGWVMNSYALGDTMASGFLVGGLIASVNAARVTNCYSIGSATGQGTSVGGLIGDNYSSTIINSFWDTTTSGTTMSSGGEGKPTAEMKQRTTFETVEWNFTADWGIQDGKTYPYLVGAAIPWISITGSAVGTAQIDERYKAQVIWDVAPLPTVPNEGEVSMKTDARWLTMDPNGKLRGTPSGSDVGVWTVNLTVTDDVDRVGSLSFQVVVLAENLDDVPVITTEALPDAVEDEPYSFTLLAEDPDVGDSLTWTLLDDIDWLDLDAVTGELSGTPRDEDVGSVFLVVSVTDSADLQSTREFRIDINDTNDPPEVVTTIPTVIDVQEDEPFEMSLEAVDDYDGDLRWSETTSLFMIGTDDGTFGFTPTQEDIGEWYVNVTVEDSEGLGTTVELRFMIHNVNDPPTINLMAPLDGAKYKEGEAVKMTVDAVDVDGDNLTVAWTVNDKVIGTGETLDYKKLRPGERTIKVTVSDGIESVEMEATITIEEGNDGPGPGLIGVLVAFAIVLLVRRSR